MNAEGWKAVIRQANQDERMLELLAKLLEEADSAKNTLQQLGFGCTGTPWPKIVDEVREAKTWIDARS